MIVKLRSALLGAWLVALIGLGWGCGMEDGALGLDPDAAEQSDTGFAMATLGTASYSLDGLIALLVPPDLTAPRSTKKLIRAATGGVVELNGYRVAIPARALARDTFVTINLPTSLPEAGYVVADFAPHGLRFSRPVTITLPLSGAKLAGIDLSKVIVGYWNGSKWENYGGTATSQAVSTTTTHFSTYGARRGGIDTTAGG